MRRNRRYRRGVPGELDRAQHRQATEIVRLLFGSVVRTEHPKWYADGSMRVVVHCPPPSLRARCAGVRAALVAALESGTAELSYGTDRRDAALTFGGEMRVDLRGGGRLAREAATELLERDG